RPRYYRRASLAVGILEIVVLRREVRFEAEWESSDMIFVLTGGFGSATFRDVVYESNGAIPPEWRNRTG
ncbi:MAG: hypothetical protein QGG36_14870, partial [Pirellulaceae bacterium]|nr:hypothetical protein [Pirellulaceae bacterium]